MKPEMAQGTIQVTKPVKGQEVQAAVPDQMQPEMAQEVQAAVPDQAGVQADQGLLFVVGKGKSKEKPEMAHKKPVMAPRPPVHLCPKTLTGTWTGAGTATSVAWKGAD